MGANMIDVTMPSLGADMTEGTLIEWLVTIGDQVKKGDVIAVLETDKGAIDMETYQAGKVSEILVQPVTKVPVGTVLARLDSDSLQFQSNQRQQHKTLPTLQAEPAETKKNIAKKSHKETLIDNAFSEQVSAKKEIPVASPAQPTIDTAIDSNSNSNIKASPLVRKMVGNLQLNLSTIKGSGPDGAVLLNDVLNGAVNDSNEVVDESENIKKTPIKNKTSHLNSSAMRTAISLAMEKSKREIPHYYLSLDIDVSKTQQWLHAENINREPDQRQLLLAVLLKAVASTLIKFPLLNGYYLNHQFQTSKGVHIGNAISLRNGGLVVPAIHHVEKLSKNNIMDALRDIVNRSRRGRLRSSELTDASITVTNMGDRGSDTVFGVIYPPQVAIIGFGRPRQVPQVKDNTVIVSDMMTISLSADHRVSDGGVGANFLHSLSQKLQIPESL